MKLQISFDITDLDRALTLSKEIAPFCDIIEVGTLLIYHHGVRAIQAFKDTHPDKPILADAKIVDRAKDAVNLLLDAQVDWITVMAGTSKNVIHTACSVAKNRHKKVMIDLLDSSSFGQSALEAKNLGADALLFHEPHDAENGISLADKWEMVRGNTDLPIFVSAKINRDNINLIMAMKPYGIIVGKGITEHKNPAEEAQFYYELCKTAAI